MPPKTRSTTPALDLSYSLGNLSSGIECLVALRDGLGFSLDEIGKALGVAAETVRKWLKNERGFSDRNAEALDDFRAIVELLYRGLVLEQGLPQTAVVSWFRRRPRRGVPVPLDYVFADPGTVGGAAEAQVLGDMDTVARLMLVASQNEPEPVAVPDESEELPEEKAAEAAQAARRAAQMDQTAA